ncbi:chitin deacetylase [Boothiomyces sp. JEL0866]|nr:chitin deacetylase [Boothiomyces sp. JEL0866]
MDYPSVERGTPVDPSPLFNQQYQSVMTIKSGPSLEFEKTSCISNTDWALTYDDGPSEFTSGVVTELAKRNFKGTFFVVGAQVKKNPEVLVDAFNAGMEIGIHTWSHPVLTRLSNEQIVAELMYTFNIIKDVIGVECRYFRAPFGTTDGRVRGIAQALGFIMIRWNRDTGDATTNGKSLKPQFDKFMKEPVISTISLEHDLHAETALLAPYGMDILINSPYSEKSISQCTGEQPYGRIEPFPLKPSTSAIQVSVTTLAPPITAATSLEEKATMKEKTFSSAPLSFTAIASPGPIIVNGESRSIPYLWVFLLFIQPIKSHRKTPIDLPMKYLLISTAFGATISHLSSGYNVNPKLTPGCLCTKSDINFQETRYKENIPYCKRNVATAEKQRVAKNYNVPQSSWSNYEFDHFIPLAIGGSDDDYNLWPEPLTADNSLAKDKVEEQAYQGMNSGTLTQKEAVQMILDWVNKNLGQSYDLNTVMANRCSGQNS